MADSKYFTVPFGATGDRAVIPDATQPGGQVSYQQGFGPDYGRNPASDPLAKRVPRDQTNEYLYQITNALKFIQLYGAPEWYATDDLGATVNYPISARVRHNAGAGMQAWRSLVANNTATPGSDATKWALDEAFSFSALEASVAETTIGSSSSKVITPRRLAQVSRQAPWNIAVTTGTASAYVAALTPVPASLSDISFAILKIYFHVANAAGATINVNGLGPVAIRAGMSTGALPAGYFQAGETVELFYDGSVFRTQNIFRRTGDVLQSFDATKILMRMVMAAGQTASPISVENSAGQVQLNFDVGQRGLVAPAGIGAFTDAARYLAGNLGSGHFTVTNGVERQQVESGFYNAAGTGDVTVTYPIAFKPGTIPNVIVIPFSGSISATETLAFSVISSTPTQFIVAKRYVNNGGGVGAATQPFFWTTVGQV